MNDPLYDLRLRVRGWLVDNHKNQAQLSKLSELSESTISGLLSGNCLSLSLPSFARLQAIVSSPLAPDIHSGTRITALQVQGKKLSGSLELTRDDVDRIIALGIAKDQREVFEANENRNDEFRS